MYPKPLLDQLRNLGALDAHASWGGGGVLLSAHATAMKWATTYRGLQVA
jgi:hypothetical protein